MPETRQFNCWSEIATSSRIRGIFKIRLFKTVLWLENCKRPSGYTELKTFDDLIRQDDIGGDVEIKMDRAILNRYLDNQGQWEVTFIARGC